MKQSKLNDSTYYEYFELIDDTPENVARMLLVYPSE